MEYDLERKYQINVKMSINITNKQILSFFEQHPTLDPEIMILKFINIMESLQENMNKTLNNSTVLEILDSINSLKRDNESNLSKYMLEIKRGLNEDIRMIMSNSINERLEPTLREKLKEEQIQLVHNVSGRLEQLLENKISGIKESTSASREILSTQHNTLNDLLKRFENSSKKGKISENILFNILSIISTPTLIFSGS